MSVDDVFWAIILLGLLLVAARIIYLRPFARAPRPSAAEGPLRHRECIQRASFM